MFHFDDKPSGGHHEGSDSWAFVPVLPVSYLLSLPYLTSLLRLFSYRCFSPSCLSLSKIYFFFLRLPAFPPLFYSPSVFRWPSVVSYYDINKTFGGARSGIPCGEIELKNTQSRPAGLAGGVNAGLDRCVTKVNAIYFDSQISDTVYAGLMGRDHFSVQKWRHKSSSRRYFFSPLDQQQARYVLFK